MRRPHAVPAVVATMSFSGLGIARSLGRRGIPVLLCDPSPHQVGMNSRFGEPRICPNPGRAPEAFVDFLLELGRASGFRPVLFPTGDRVVLLISKYRQVLSERFRFLLPEPGLLEALVRKDGLDELVRRHRIPAPRSWLPVDAAAAARAAREMEYPALIKAVLSPTWYNPAVSAIVGAHGKVAVAHSAEELLSYYHRIAAIEPRMVFQELIPGDDDRCYYVCMYCDERGEPTAGFAGQKVRLFPPHFGSASYARTVHDEGLLELARSVVRRFGYRGLCGIEFKRDPRDERYKLIEFNARFGLWDCLGEQAGVDLAGHAYRAALGERPGPSWSYREGLSWVSFQRDLGAYRAYRQEGSLSLASWLPTVLGCDAHAVFALDDLRPFISSTLELLRGRLERLMGPRSPVPDAAAAVSAPGPAR